MVRIEVLRGEDYKALSRKEHSLQKTPQDIERDQINTVVHELVHLRLADLTNNLEATDEEKAAEEIVVVRITSALLREKILQ